ncbi:FtsX-like permease family protein [Candidatus Dojkabacteria bacterium]|nr:FtsX-like permease family protein [Candidatus Dojkabacteria bacterium]
MIKGRDASKLALTKYKQRKVRTITSGCSISLGIIILLVFLVGTTGVNNTLKKIFRDTISFKNYVAVDASADSSVQKTVENTYKGEYIGRTAQLDGISDHLEFCISPLLDQVSSEYTYFTMYNLVLVPEFIAHDYLAEGYSFDDKYDGKIPVIIPITDLAYIKNNVAVWDMSSREQYDFFHDLAVEYLGKEISISYEAMGHVAYDETNDPTSWTELDNRFVIVGFSHSGFGSLYTMGYYNSLIIPDWAKSELMDSKVLSLTAGKSIYKLQNPKDVKKVVKDLWTNPVYGIVEQTHEFTKITRNIGLGLGSFFLIVSAFSVFFTVNKIVSESKREIGVFRAVGATRADIRKILYKYALLITNVGFVIGLVLSIGFNVVLSLFWGSSLFYALAVNSMQMSVSKPMFFFVGFPWAGIILIYFIGLITTFVGTTIPAFRASLMPTVTALRDE